MPMRFRLPRDITTLNLGQAPEPPDVYDPPDDLADYCMDCGAKFVRPVEDALCAPCARQQLADLRAQDNAIRARAARNQTRRAA